MKEISTHITLHAHTRPHTLSSLRSLMILQKTFSFSSLNSLPNDNNMAQELLTTFQDEIHEVSLIPSSGGTFVSIYVCIFYFLS